MCIDMNGFLGAELGDAQSVGDDILDVILAFVQRHGSDGEIARGGIAAADLQILGHPTAPTDAIGGIPVRRLVAQAVAISDRNRGLNGRRVLPVIGPGLKIEPVCRRVVRRDKCEQQDGQSQQQR